MSHYLLIEKKIMLTADISFDPYIQLNKIVHMQMKQDSQRENVKQTDIEKQNTLSWTWYCTAMYPNKTYINVSQL